MLPQWEYDAQKVLYIVSPLLYNIDTLDDKDLPLCVPNGLETAIHWIQWRHCSCKKWRTHLVKATRDILDVVFVQKLFCSVYYCLSVHNFFEVAEKNYLIWDFFQRSIWLQRHAIEKPFGFAVMAGVSGCNGGQTPTIGGNKHGYNKLITVLISPIFTTENYITHKYTYRQNGTFWKAVPCKIDRFQTN